MKTTKIIIELEIEGNPEQAFATVDGLLDAGTLQDAIYEAEDYGNGRLAVTSAIVRFVDRCPACKEVNCHCVTCGTPCTTECVGPDHDYEPRGERT